MSEAVPGTSTLKHSRGKFFRSGEKKVILHAFQKLAAKNPTMAVRQVEELTSELLGVSARSIGKMRSELRGTGKVTTPYYEILVEEKYIVNVSKLIFK